MRFDDRDSHLYRTPATDVDHGYRVARHGTLFGAAWFVGLLQTGNALDKEQVQRSTSETVLCSLPFKRLTLFGEWRSGGAIDCARVFRSNGLSPHYIGHAQESN